jgi:hypothetical protein
MTEHIVVVVILWTLAISAIVGFAGFMAVSTIMIFRHLWQLLQRAWEDEKKA